MSKGRKFHPTAYARALEFRAEQRVALLSEDPKQLMALFDKWSPPRERARLRAEWAKGGDFFMLTVIHKTRAALVLSDTPEDRGMVNAQLASIRWLEENGMTVRSAKELAEISARERRRKS